MSRNRVLARLGKSREAAGEQGTETRRAAYLVAVLLGLQRIRGRVAVTPLPEETATPSAEVVVTADSGAMAALSGLTRTVVDTALATLVDAAVLSRSDVESTGIDGTTGGLLSSTVSTFEARFASDVLVPLPAADAVDWPFVLNQLEGNAAALLTSWAFAELLARPDRYASVPRSVLQAHTLYGEGMVKRALGTLLRTNIVERTAQNAYRFSDLALGRRVSPTAPTRTASGSETRTAAPTPVDAASPSSFVNFMAGGLPLALPRDTPIEIETEIDGRPIKVRIRFPSA